MYVWQRWLASGFRAAGLTVIEVAGWENRGRPASTGHFDPRGLIVNHHTGATSSPSNPRPGLNTLIYGRSDLPGPLCQYAIDWNGVVIVVAAGRANVNGRKRTVANWPESDGNTQMGVEVITNGTQVLSAAQIHSMAVTNAVVLRHWDRPPDGWVWKHADISLSGKWDIGNRTRAQLIADVQALGGQPPPPPPPPSYEEDDDMAKILQVTPGADDNAADDSLWLVTSDGAAAIGGNEIHSVSRILSARPGEKVLQVEMDQFNAVARRASGR